MEGLVNRPGFVAFMERMDSYSIRYRDLCLAVWRRCTGLSFPSLFQSIHLQRNHTTSLLSFSSSTCDGLFIRDPVFLTASLEEAARIGRVQPTPDQAQKGNSCIKCSSTSYLASPSRKPLRLISPTLSNIPTRSAAAPAQPSALPEGRKSRERHAFTPFHHPEARLAMQT